MLGNIFGAGPDRFGEYRRTRPLGEGGMAVLYEGEHSKTGRKVIIKVLDESKVWTLHEGVWEGEIAKGLKHPNLVQTYDCGKTRNKYYIIMETLDGPDLKTRANARDPWLNGRRLKILKDAAKGLLHMHDHKLVHRDFNPRNVLFRNEEGVVIDFGLTTSMYFKTKETADRRGTPSYMAPELVMRNQIDQRTDIYAFGISMYEVFTGQLPFTGDSVFDKMQKAVSYTIRPPSTVRPELSQRADDVVMRAIVKEPEKRFQSMREVLRRLAFLDESDIGG